MNQLIVICCIFVIVVVFFGMIITYTVDFLEMALPYILNLGLALLPILITLGVAYIIFNILAEIYYCTSSFKNIKSNINNHVKDCNDLNEHIEDLKKSFSKIYKSDNIGVAQYTNTSLFNYKKPFLNNESRSENVYECSLTVCRNAQREPLKYMCKYFNMPENEETLNYFESILNDFSAAEQGKDLLKKEKESILESIKNDVPFFIRYCDKNRLIRKLGFIPIDLKTPYFPQYAFRYISPGGNSSQTVDITLDLNNLNDLVIYLSSKIKYNKSAKKQRALMTLELREKIKERDNYTCKICNLSTYDEPNLLLEIDHIIPISKGGLSTEDNLQTLCWKCNRHKGNKIQ